MKKSLLYRFIADQCITPFCKVIPLSCGAILMLHHVAPIHREKIRYNDHLNVSPEYLDQILFLFKKNGFSFVSMDELAELLKKRKRFSKILSVTFDDGYRDNLKNGLPVLESHNIPGIVYVATGLMRGEIIPWWDILEEYILNIPSGFEFEGKFYSTETMDGKNKTFLTIRERIRFDSDPEIRCRLLADGILSNNGSGKDYHKNMLTEKDLKQYAGHRLLSFGSHTHSHIACGKLPPDVFEKELKQSLEILQNCGIDVRHFAFPYGDDVKPREDLFQILQNNRIVTAVTTCAGLVCPKSNSLFLPRYFVSEYSEESVIRNIYAGKRSVLYQSIKRRLHWQ